MEEQPPSDIQQSKPWLFKPGESGNPAGRKPDTLEQKLIRKSRKELIEEYKDALAEALPLINPVLVKKAIEGDVPAIKELHDRVMDKAKQNTDVTSGGETINQVLVKFIDAPTTNN